ncbi:MAG: BrnA antitoxin family protein [Betaproteobacteria bacterium]|nr:BrnA antitoxin family protein [Betaproteobacteria bacterium]
MKSDTTQKAFPANPEEWERIVANAPETVDDPDCPYDPNDAAAVEAYWSHPDVIVSHSLAEFEANMAERRKRGPNKRPKKEQVSIRYSPEVLAAFRATGRGWQARMDEALQEWLKGQRTA